MLRLYCFAILLSAVLSATLPNNPCPRVFQYVTSENGITSGSINVPYDGETKKITLSVNASLVGIFNSAKMDITLKSPREEILGSQRLHYDLHFPFREDIPRITQIVFNNDVFCSGPPFPLLPGSGVTNIWASSVYTIRTFTTTFNDPKPQPVDANFAETPPNLLDDPFSTQKPQVIVNLPPSSTKPPPKDIKTEIESNCGVENSVQNLIVNGEATQENQYPWVVAMMVVSSKAGYQYHCTANLISDRHVITAGQCVQFFSVKVVNTEDILLIIGKSDLTRWATSDAERRTAKKVIVHPDYTQYSGHGDLCIIEFFPPVEFKKTIKPICLWKGDTSLEPYVHRKGKVCGWGHSKTQRDDSVASYQAVSLPIVSQEECLRSSIAYHNLTSSMTFCAGDRSGSGPCIGDSGAGFAVQNDDKRWSLRGLVSIALKNADSCKLDDYVVFCDVAKYVEWIRNIVNL